MNDAALTSQFCIALRAQGQVVVPRDEGPLRLRTFPAADRHFSIEFATRFDSEEFGIDVPRELTIVLRAPANDLEEAAERFWRVGNSMIGYLVLSANAFVDEPALHVAYDDSPGLAERTFLQNLEPDQSGPPQNGRKLRIEATRNLIRAALSSPHRQRVHRAVEQYRMALRYWRQGEETPAVEHVFMGMEALKVSLLTRALEGRTERELIEAWGVRVDDSGKARAGDLQAAALRELICEGDEAFTRQMRDVSDSLEHGYGDFEEINRTAVQVRDRAARLLRSAILGSVDLDEQTLGTLLNEPLVTPLTRSGLTFRTWARIVGDGEPVTGDGSPYPHYRKPEHEFRLAGDSRAGYSVQGTFNATASLGRGLQFKNDRFEVWGPPRQEGPSRPE